MPYFKHHSTLHEVRDLGQGRYSVDGEEIEARYEAHDRSGGLLRRGPAQAALHVHASGDKYQVWYQGEYYELSRQSRSSGTAEAGASDRIKAPLTGKVILVNVEVGDPVAKGVTLAVLESMKMETALAAPADGTVRAVHCAPGDQVANEQLLIELDLEAEA